QKSMCYISVQIPKLCSEYMLPRKKAREFPSPEAWQFYENTAHLEGRRGLNEARLQPFLSRFAKHSPVVNFLLLDIAFILFLPLMILMDLSDRNQSIIMLVCCY